MSKANIKKGSTVTVIAGDDKGKSGKVLQVIPETGRVLVEGVNFVKKHMQKSEDNPQGGIVEREAPVAISNLKVSD
jgi:large subunit ribosomal protein L24